MLPGELDKLILARVQPRWRKTAFIIAAVEQSLGLEQSDDQAIAARIVGLVKAGKLEAQGNIDEWRYSEVRLTQK
jgi:hypothetical protein